jgi:hypothetical protein
VACDFGHHAILLDVKANFAKRGTPIQSQNSHGSSPIVVLEKSSAGQQHADTAHPLYGDQTRRHAGLPGSTSSRPTGAIPNSAITAGSFTLLGTPG